MHDDRRAGAEGHDLGPAVLDDSNTSPRPMTDRNRVSVEVTGRLEAADLIEYQQGCRHHADELRRQAARWAAVELAERALR
jgi:hypothetical protein